MLVLLVLGTFHKYASRVAERSVTHVDASRLRQDVVRNLGVLNTTRSAAWPSGSESRYYHGRDR